MRTFNRSGEVIKTASSYVPQPKKQVDWMEILDTYKDAKNEYDDRTKREALVNALNNGDENEINSAYAAIDPTGAYANRLAEKQAQQAHEWDMARLDKQHYLAKALADYKQGQSAPMADNSAIANALAGVSLTGNKTYDNALLKNVAKNNAESLAEQQEYAAAFAETQDAYNRMFGDNGHVGKANIDNWVERRLPTEFLEPKVREARGSIKNIMGGLRLNESERMKGALSDREQEFLNAMVSGDYAKHTPEEMKGAFEAILEKLKQKSQGVNNVNNVIDYTSI